MPQIHVDQRNVFLNPLEPDAVYYCNDGGLYRYQISTDVFTNLSDGLAITQYYDIAVAQTDANVVGGGSQDNGNVFRDSNGNWRQYAPTGDGINQEIDPTDADTRYWATANEENVREFRVERSAEGRDFVSLGTVPAGNTPTKTYAFLDQQAHGRLAYYRIRAEDLDGTLSYTDIQRVSWRENDGRAASLYPNPVAEDQLQVAWTMPAPAKVTWLLYNAWGQEIRRGHLGADAGANKVELAVTDLPAGVYLLRLRAKDWDWTEQFVRR